MSITKKIKYYFNTGNLLPCLLLFSSVFILYGHTISFGLVVFDDNILVKNPLYESIKNIPLFFKYDIFNSGSRFYRPVLSISLMADYLLHTSGYWVFHFTNVMLHAIACVLIYFFIMLNGFGRKTSITLTLLFAVHPAFVQSTAWIPGRNDTLLACFVISSLIAFSKYAENVFSSTVSDLTDISWAKNKWLTLHIFLFIAALFTKETAVMLPFAAYAMIYSNLISQLNREKLNKSVKLILPQTIVLFFYFFVRKSAVLGAADIEYLESLKGLLLIPVLFFKNFIELDFCVYKRWAYFSIPVFIFFCSLIALGFVLSDRRIRSKYVFGIISALFFLAPVFLKTKGIFPFFLGHRFYLPSAFLLISVASLSIGEKSQNIQKHISSGIKWGIYSVFFLFLMCLSYIQCSYFKDTNVFWERACIEIPNDFTAQAMAAINYYDRHMIIPAAYHAKKALEINPWHEDMNMVLGIYSAKQGNIRLSLEYMEKEIKNNPKNTVAAMLIPQLQSLISQGIFYGEINFKYRQ